MSCPNHDDTQICPDCTYRYGHKLTDSGTGINYQAAIEPPLSLRSRDRARKIQETLRTLPPLEQHKADLEMIVAACVTGADMTGEAACAAIAQLANVMLLRLEINRHVVTDSKCSCVGDQS